MRHSSSFNWLLLLLLSTLSCGARSGIPDLPLRFTAIVEANILQKNKTYIMEEWYDWPASKAKRVWYANDVIQTSYEDFSSDLDQLWLYTTTHQDTSTAQSCQLVANSNSSSRSRFDETKGGHLVSSADWFQFGGNMTETYLGNEFVVRGINAEAWTRNSSYSYSYAGVTVNISYALTYYFNLPSWDWFNSSQSQVPIRVDLEGERVTTVNGTGAPPTVYAFHHYYDYVQFMADDLTIDDALALDIDDWWTQCDISEYCAVYPDVDICQTTPTLPALPEHKYFTIIESTDVVRETTRVLKVWYNYDANEMRTEYYADDAVMVTFDQLDENKRFFWTHPYNDTDTVNTCEVYPYSQSISPDMAQFAAEYLTTGHLKSVTDFWRFGADYNVTYLGDDFTVRNIHARAYRTTAETRTNHSTLWVESLFYFADANWSYYDGIETADVPLRLRYKGGYESALTNTSHEFEIEHEFVAFFSGEAAFDLQDMEFVFADWYAQCNVTAYCSASSSYSEQPFCQEWRGPPMPTLPEQFSLTFESTHSAHNEEGEDMWTATWFLEEYYDYVGNMAHVVYHYGSSFDDDAVHELVRLDEAQQWSWVGDGDGDSIQECVLAESIENFTGIDVFVSETNGHIASPQKWFHWNDGADTTTPIWHGYTTVRGVAAQKWQSQWSEYDEVASSPLFDTYAIQLDTIVTYYWSDASWDIKGTNDWNAPIPLRMELSGVYTVYNQSKVTGEYDVFWTTNRFVENDAFIAFRAGVPNEKDLSIPQQYAQCNRTAYCTKYPQNTACIGKMDENTTANDDDKDEPNVTLYVVLMIVLFVLGLVIGAAIDRCVVRRKGQHEFQQVTNVNDAVDANGRL